jgi:hypothetical protein
MALLTGVRIRLISSVYFQAIGAGPLTDAGGPLLNMIVAGLLFVWLRKRKPAASSGHLLAAATMALNLFWAAGYFLFTGITAKGDWAFLLGAHGSPRALVMRGLLLVAGVLSYRFAILTTKNALLPYAETRRRPWWRISLLLYVSAGLTCCFAGLFFHGPLPLTFKDSAIESFGAFFGLPWIARWKPAADIAIPPGRAIPRDWRWILGSMAGAAVYVLILGRGYFPA